MPNALLLIAIHLGMALIDLPAAWGRPERRRDAWAGAVLLAASLCLALLVAFGYRLIGVWRLLEAVCAPIGTPLFKSGPG